MTWEPPTTLTDGSELTSSLGFLVHYRADEGEEHTIDVTDDAACGASECAVTVRDERFAGGDRYCFTVSAYDADDHSSARSNPACKEF